MAAFVDNSSLDVRERNSMAITLNIHTKSHTVHGRPTLKLLERFGNGLIHELYERSIYEPSFTSEPSIGKYQAKPRTCTCKNQKLLWNISEEGKETAGICLWALWSQHTEVRRVTKNVCKLHTKRIRLNKVAQHEKKYLLNCSVPIYQRIIKLKYLSHMFSCNKPTCLYKRQTPGGGYSLIWAI